MATADQAKRRVDRLVVGILSFQADRIYDERAELVAQAATLMQQLLSFDRFAAGRQVQLSGKLSSLLIGQGTAELAKVRDVSQWQAARAALLAESAESGAALA